MVKPPSPWIEATRGLALYVLYIARDRLLFILQRKRAYLVSCCFSVFLYHAVKILYCTEPLDYYQ